MQAARIVRMVLNTPCSLPAAAAAVLTIQGPFPCHCLRQLKHRREYHSAALFVAFYDILVYFADHKELPNYNNINTKIWVKPKEYPQEVYDYLVKKTGKKFKTLDDLLAYIRDIGVRFDEGIIHEDEKMSFLAYVLADRVECIGDRLYKRRYRYGSIMTSKSFQKSSYGYIVAIGGIMNAFSELSLSDLQKSLFEYYIRLLFGKVRTMYAKLYHEKTRESRSASQKINNDAKMVMKSIRIFKKDMSSHEKAATYDLRFGVWLKRIKTINKK